MAAKIITISSNLIYTPDEVERLWFFPNGSEFLKYSPHFHLWYETGFRMNIPLCGWAPSTFVIVEEGKFSIKNYYGGTVHKIHVRDQVWYDRSVKGARASEWYQRMLKGIFHGAQLPRSVQDASSHRHDRAWA